MTPRTGSARTGDPQGRGGEGTRSIPAAPPGRGARGPQGARRGPRAGAGQISAARGRAAGAGPWPGRAEESDKAAGPETRSRRQRIRRGGAPVRAGWGPRCALLQGQGSGGPRQARGGVRGARRGRPSRATPGAMACGRSAALKKSQAVAGRRPPRSAGRRSPARRQERCDRPRRAALVGEGARGIPEAPAGRAAGAEGSAGGAAPAGAAGRRPAGLDILMT